MNYKYYAAPNNRRQILVKSLGRRLRGARDREEEENFFARYIELYPVRG